MTTDIQPTDPGALQILPPAQPMQSNSIAMIREHAAVMQTAFELAEAMCQTSLVPSIYRGKAQDATAAILYGSELGLTPIQSLQQIFTVHGTPAIYARTMVALLKRRGYRFSTTESTNESVTVWGGGPDGSEETSTWTIERATQAGYVPTLDEQTGKYKTNANGKLIGNEKYLTDPQAMLYAKAATEVCRRLAPDVLLGIAATEGDIESEDRPAPPKKVDVTQVGVDELRARLAGGKEPEPVAAPAGEPAEEPEPEPTPEETPAKPSALQNRKLNALFERAGLTKEDKSGRQIVAAALHPAPATADGTQHIIDQLEGAAARGDDALVDTVQAIITEHDEANQ